MPDQRDWRSYNDVLVRRGEISISPSMVELWRKELRRENRGKVGVPYRYPESFVRLIACMRLLFHLPYRQAEGFITFLSRHKEGLSAPDYSTIARRTNKLSVTLDDSLIESNNPVSIAVDSSGIKVHNGGDWVRKVVEGEERLPKGAFGCEYSYESDRSHGRIIREGARW